MKVAFPGGKRVDAEYKGFTIRTDQSPRAGGEGSAPQPFDLFLASIATCAGIYVKGYCDARGIATDSLALEMDVVHDPERERIGRLVLRIILPEGFPESHRPAVVRAANLCSVKKHMFDPPAFEISATVASTPGVEAVPTGDAAR